MLRVHNVTCFQLHRGSCYEKSLFMNDCTGITSYELTNYRKHEYICSKTLRFDDGRQLARFSIVLGFITKIITTTSDWRGKFKIFFVTPSMNLRKPACLVHFIC